MFPEWGSWLRGNLCTVFLILITNVVQISEMLLKAINASQPVILVVKQDMPEDIKAKMVFLAET